MNTTCRAAMLSALLLAISSPLIADDHAVSTAMPSATAAPEAPVNRMIAGFDEKNALVVRGAKDVVTGPERIVNETTEDMKNFGAGGLITGPIVGGIKGAGQMATGGGRILIGILDILSAPVRESRYIRSQPGNLR